MTTPNPELSIALAHLLRGPVHEEDSASVWASVTALGAQLRDHLDALGLRLVVDEVERYVYLRAADELPEGMPRLVRRHALTFGATVLLILLRQQMTTAETAGDKPRLIVTATEMIESLRLYHRDGTSEERIAADIAVLEKLGYLRRLRGSDDEFEVRRIIKAIVTADWIAEYGGSLRAANGDRTAPDADDEAVASAEVDGEDGR